jgi:hypothetical protein
MCKSNETEIELIMDCHCVVLGIFFSLRLFVSDTEFTCKRDFISTSHDEDRRHSLAINFFSKDFFSRINLFFLRGTLKV